MNKNELRINVSLIQDRNKNVCRVDGLRNEEHDEISAWPIKGGGHVALPFEPILLTKELLLKFGWKHYNGKKSGTLTRDTFTKIDVDWIDGILQIKSHYEPAGHYRPLYLKYVHELQNWWYWNNNKEELTLTK